MCAPLAIVVCVTLSARAVEAQSQSPRPVRPPDASRIERLENMVTTVVEENRRLAAEVQALKEQLEAHQPETPSPSLPIEAPAVPNHTGAVPPSPPNYWTPMALPNPPPRSPGHYWGNSTRFRVDYDNGFAILPDNLDDTPFSLTIRSQNVFRYNGFARGERFWTDSAGIRQPIDNSNYFGIPRGRLIFSGHALLPRLTYLLNIDYNSVTNNPIGFRAYELSYRFSRALALSVGQSKVPGSREWLESAFAPLQGPDRSMATTFFRPSLSQGIWITGEPADGWFYHAMLSNGFNTLNLEPNRLDNRFCWSGSTWWEPWGVFGPGYSDLQDHEDPAVRLGGSYTFALGSGNQADSDAVENSSIRLSDGTLITTKGAIAPGVTLQTYDIALAAVDLAFKYRGLGVSTELYSQTLESLKGDGPLPINSTRAFGGFVQGGYFVIPRTAELYARSSFVTGKYGSGSELAAGFNWFLLEGRDNLRFTFDAAWLDSSPAGQNRTGFVAGQTGLLLRTQITVQY
jgi:hypothetical protein